MTISNTERYFQRPFRSPHDTISNVSLLGGGSIPKPGEVSLSHNGVLFMDELPEFKRSALEVLRQPLEDGEVTISRSAAKTTLPSSIMLVATYEPLSLRLHERFQARIRCTVPQVQLYRHRISNPLLSRIDIDIEAPALRIEELRNAASGETSKEIHERVKIPSKAAITLPRGALLL